MKRERERANLAQKSERKKKQRESEKEYMSEREGGERKGIMFSEESHREKMRVEENLHERESINKR